MVSSQRLGGLRRLGYLLGLWALHVTMVVVARAQPAPPQKAIIDAADAVCGKQVVLLGELPSHGEARGFQAKAQIVERLVSKCGFNTVLFEAPMYDFVGFQRAVAADTAAQVQLERAIGRFWSPRELAEWRRWLFERATHGGLKIGGLDDQLSVTSEYGRAILPGLVARWSAPQRASECEQVTSRNFYYRYDATHPFDDAEHVRLQECTRAAADSIRLPRDTQTASVDQMMLADLADYAERQLKAAAAPDRDRTMARTAEWYIAHLPKGSKVIIWTATVHAARRRGELSTMPLGTRLAQRFGDDVAAIGFTALGGESSMAGRPAKALPDLSAGSLEEKATSTDTAWVLLKAADLRRLGALPSRLMGKEIVADWSTYFDMVLVIRQELAPMFDPAR